MAIHIFFFSPDIHFIQKITQMSEYFPDFLIVIANRNRIHRMAHSNINYTHYNIRKHAS